MASRVTRQNLDNVFMGTFAAPQAAYIPDGLIERSLSDIEVDSFPSVTRPIPSAMKLTADIGSLMEPALCVTPEKNRARISVKAKTSRSHVRFDPKVTVELNSSESLQGSSSSMADSSDCETLKADAGVVLEAPDSLDETLEPITIMASDLKLNDPVEDSSSEGTAQVDSAQTESVLSRPEMHTTLWLERGVKQVQADVLDVPAAVRQKLKACSRTRSEINEKACSKVNVENDQFSQLPSLEVCETDILQAASMESTNKTRHSNKSKSFKDEITAGEEPDIMLFFSRDFEKETASYNVEGLPSLKEGATTVDLERAFDVYKHIRSWEGW